MRCNAGSGRSAAATVREISEGVVRVEPPSAQAARVGDVIYTPHATATSGSHVELVTAVTKDKEAG
jgi:hypothetical protein